EVWQLPANLVPVPPVPPAMSDMPCVSPLRILVCGANGFIGRHVAEALAQRGHEVLRGVRHPATSGAPDARTEVEIDFAQDGTAQDWLPRLQGVDVVINTVGIMREGPGVSFDALHVRGPLAL